MDIYQGASPFTNVFPAGIVTGFVGRRAELDVIREAFTRGAKGVTVVGAPGIGKTSLAHVFAKRHEGEFPGGVFSGAPMWADSSAELLKRLLNGRKRGAALLVLNDADALDDRELEVLRSVVAADLRLRLILTSRRELSLGNDYMTIRLGGLDRGELHELFELRSAVARGRFAPELVERLFSIGGGNPAFASFALGVVQSGQVRTWDELFSRLREFAIPGILGPDGRPATRESPVFRQVVVDITSANELVIELLKKQPDLAWSLPPRKFEEIVAEILNKQGYDVELTPASGDGGFDIYAARKEGLGRFLYLVECKRYRPPNKVGVEIVRSLHGVIQAKRATAGAIVTTSYFTAGAKEYQQELQYQLHLHDYLVLQHWISEFPSLNI
jgi:restriction system protein